MKTTPFYKAARRFAEGTSKYERIDQEVNSEYELYGIITAEADFVERLFHPIRSESKTFSCYTYTNPYYSFDQLTEQNNEFRIIALLFADLMWRDEHE